MKTNVPARVAGRGQGDGTGSWRGRSQKQSRLLEREPAGTRNEMERKGRGQRTHRPDCYLACLSIDDGGSYVSHVAFGACQ